MAVLLNRDSLGQGGGGFMDNVDAKIVVAEFTKYGFPTKQGIQKMNPPGTVFHFRTETVGDGAPVVRDDYYSVGGRLKDGTDLWAPSKDGKGLEWAGRVRDDKRAKEGPSKTSKFGVFMGSLCDALDADNLKFEIGEDISILNGLVGTWQQIPVPKNSATEAPKEGEREKTFAVITKVVSLPGVVAGSAAVGSEDVATLAYEVMETILGAAPGKTLTKAQISPKAFAALAGKPMPVKQAVAAFMVTPDFLTGGGPWSFDPSKGSVKLN